MEAAHSLTPVLGQFYQVGREHSEGCGVMQHFKGSGEFSCEAPKGAISLS
jgi:hypothetical protein